VRGDGDSIRNIQKMNNLKKLREDGYSICLPQKPKLDTGIINKLQCQLMCPVGDVIIHVTTVNDYLVRGVSVVDGNGDLVTALDNDLEKKLVVIGNDLNLWYALLQSALKDEEINIETIPGRYVKF
jgi:hypothetical protein